MSNAEQIEYWNGEAGKRWAQDDAIMARLLQPVCEALLEHAAIEGYHSALDVGCGGGSQSMLLAQRLDAGARVLGVDISQPMLEVAREKAGPSPQGHAQVDFLQADAATHKFEPGSFDLVFSRFGVMFFDEPLAAFANLRGAMRPGGRLAFCCWQAMQENAWTWIPVQAALQHLPPPEKQPPHAPGPFAFADTERLASILSGAGFADIEIHPFTPTLRLSEAPTLGDAVRDLARIGPVSRLLEGQEQAVLDKIYTAMEDVLAPHFAPGALELPAAMWFVSATNA